MGRVKTSQKIYLGMAALGYNVINIVIVGSLLVFYTNYIGLPPIYFGIAYLIWAIWNSLNDPLFGYYSDKIEPKEGKGKRLILMRISVPILIIGYFILIFNQPNWGFLIIFLMLVLGYFIYDIAATLFYINFGALILSITDDPQERAQINVICTYVYMIPTGLVSMIPFYFLTGNYSYQFILNLFIGIGIISTLITVFAIMQLEEPIERYDTDVEHYPIIKGMKEVFKSKAFIFMVIVGFALSGMAASFPPTILFILRDVYGVSGYWAIIPAMIGGALQMIMMPIILKLRDKIGSRATLFIFICLMFIGYLGFLLRPNYWVIIFFYWCILTGFTAHAICSTAIMGDVVDEDELRTGQRREGMFFGINAIFVIPASGVFVLIFTIIISIYGYEPGVKPTAEVLFGIRLGFTLLPMIFLALSMIAIYFYPLHGEHYEVLREKAQNLYEEKLKLKRENNQGGG